MGLVRACYINLELDINTMTHSGVFGTMVMRWDDSIKKRVFWENEEILLRCRFVRHREIGEFVSECNKMAKIRKLPLLRDVHIGSLVSKYQAIQIFPELKRMPAPIVWDYLRDMCCA